MECWIQQAKCGEVNNQRRKQLIKNAKIKHTVENYEKGKFFEFFDLLYPIFNDLELKKNKRRLIPNNQIE